MSLLSMLNVVLAMAGLYLMLALVASGVNERIAATLGARGWNLRIAVSRLLGPAMAKKFYAHGLVASLQEEPWLMERVLRWIGGEDTDSLWSQGRAPARWLADRVGSKPSYVRSTTFAAVALELLRDASSASSAVAVARGGIASTGDASQDLANKALQSVLDAGLRAAAAAGSTTETAVLAHLETALANHFDATMERVAGWYRRRTQIWLCCIAFGLTLGLNVDSLTLASALWADPALSSEFADAAMRMVESGESEPKEDPPPDKDASTLPTARAAWEELRKARLEALPIGWEQCDVPTHAAFGFLVLREPDAERPCPDDGARTACAALTPPYSSNECAKFRWSSYAFGHVYGWLITLFAIAAGAPFWFDMIARITNLRAAGGTPAPATTPAPEGDAAPLSPPPGGTAPGGLAAPGARGLPSPLRPAPARRLALLAAQAAELAYEKAGDKLTARATALGLGNVTTVEDAKTGTFALLGRTADDTLLVAFRGTEPTQLADAKTDLGVDLLPAEDGADGNEHAGFARALAAVRPGIEHWRASQPAGALLVCGHSLGGALACLYARGAAAKAAGAGRVLDVQLITFGCPRVGDAAHAAALNRLVPNHLRFVRDDDVVTRVPLRSMGYRHAGTVLFFDRAGLLGATPAGWLQFLNRAVLATEDLKAAAIKGVTDHSMAQYLRLVRNAFDGEDESSPAES